MPVPVVLDLFCGGGGVALGYKQAGFQVIGVDLADHAKTFAHAGEFHQGDWAEGLAEFSERADFIHASPPCQLYSQLTGWGRKDNLPEHPDLIGPVREALRGSGKPFIIENVEGAPLNDPVLLCAWTFGYEHYRHRLFESGGGLTLIQPEHREHELKARSPGHKTCGTFHSVGGNSDSTVLAREVMDIGWMKTPVMSEAIPPYYTEYLGYQVQVFLAPALGRKRQPGPEAARCVWGRPVLLRSTKRQFDQLSLFEEENQESERWSCKEDWTPCPGCPKLVEETPAQEGSHG